MTITTHNAVNTGNQPLLRRVASASAIGTAAEYYDFFAYGTAAVLFFGQLYVSAFRTTPPRGPSLAWDEGNR